MNKGRTSPVLLLGFFFLLGLLFVPECDDCYFAYWRFASLKDFLLTSPITEDAQVVGVPANGRYLGNVLGVLQGKLYFTPFGFLRGLLLGGALAGLTVLLARRFQRQGSGEALALAFSLVTLAPRGIWQQVYAWGAGFVNYLLPMAGLLLLLELLRRERPPLPACLLLSFACCLFLEPVTILLCLGGLAYAGYTLRWEKDRRAVGLVCALGAAAGTAVMFTHPGYTQVGSDTRAVGLELIQRNLTVIMTDTLIRPAAVTALISVLLVWLLRQQGSTWRPWAAMLVPIHLVCIADTLRDCFHAYNSYTTKRLLLACVLAVIWLLLLAQWRGGRVRTQVIWVILALCALNGPLLVVSPVESRNLFPSYVLLIIAAALLWSEAKGQGLPSVKGAWFPGLLACLLLIGVYGVNCAVYHQRLDLARTQAAQGAEEVTLPILPFSGWAVNEQQWKGDICYLAYRETPWDVTFHFVPYREWSPELPASPKPYLK